jgi:hypothetical protein
MLKELSKYQNLGTPSYFFELLCALRNHPDEVWDIQSVREMFYNRTIDGRSLFDGCVPLLTLVGVVSVTNKNYILIDAGFLSYLSSQNQMLDKLVEKLMIKLNEDSVFHSIFCAEYISYDIVYKAIQIDNSAFPFKYSPLKQLFIDLGIIKPHPTKELNKFVFNSRFKKLFDKVLLPEIQKRKIGIEELSLSMEQRRILGEEAEKFVLQFENKRLNGRKDISWVAEYSISDGYDIASFENGDSIEYDRFIEVKSFSDAPYFFWSRNEMDTARIKKQSYYLYLVDRNRMNREGYQPLIIQDPYANVLHNNLEWDQRVEKIRFELKKRKE